MSWKSKRNTLTQLINRLSQLAGGDDAEFLNEYVSEILTKYDRNLDVAITCFEDLIKQYE